TGVGYAVETADKVMPWLDAQAERWRSARTQACTSATVEQAWTADDLERARWCLDERRMELGALVDELLRAEADSASKAVQAAAGLSSIEPCGDVELLRRVPAPPDDSRDEIAATKETLARASAASRVGDYDEALRVGAEGIEAARAVSWVPLK